MGKGGPGGGGVSVLFQSDISCFAPAAVWLTTPYALLRSPLPVSFHILVSHPPILPSFFMIMTVAWLEGHGVRTYVLVFEHAKRLDGDVKGRKQFVHEVEDGLREQLL